MDLLGRKARAALDALEKEHRELATAHMRYIDEVNQLRQANDKLIKTLRDMDQLIYIMSQKTSWDAMRPTFQQLNEGTKGRMEIESGRIRNLLTNEVRKAYNG